MSQFYKYFRENMLALGLPAPESLYANQGLVVGHVETLLAALKKFGRNATMGELIGATTGLEKLAVGHTVWASYYIGAVIGSMAVATGRSFAGGTSLADVLELALRTGTHRPWLQSTLMRWPGIFDASVGSRHMYVQIARRS